MTQIKPTAHQIPTKTQHKNKHRPTEIDSDQACFRSKAQGSFNVRVGGLWAVMQVFVVMLMANFVAYGHCMDYLRLSTETGVQKILMTGDSLISTLGTYKATLQQHNCQFLLQKFSPQTLTYKPIGTLRSKLANYNCSYLKILNGQIQTQQNFTYFFTTVLEYNHSTILTIDQLGVLRLVATIVRGIAERSEGDLLSYQINFTDYQQKVLEYLFSATVLNVEFFDSFGWRVNKNNWNFSANLGQLQIKYSGNSTSQMLLTQYYYYQSFKLNNSRFFDFTYNTFPGLVLNNISYHPSCSSPKNHIQFHAPYTIEMDPYWPILSFYEQGRYKILEIAVARLVMEEERAQIGDTGGMYHYRYYSPCPKRSFELLGDCVSSCPEPFYHELRGDVGKCVLTCEENSQVLVGSRICRCMTPYEVPFISSAKIVHNCTPVRGVETPFGCICKNDYYYDYTQTFDCVLKDRCPANSIPYKGLCMQCPPRCTKCLIDPSENRLNFLKCTQCQPGYTTHYGICRKKCVNFQAKISVYNSSGQYCIACSDPNCFQCTDDGAKCLKCLVTFSLSDGACVFNCGASGNGVVGYSVYAGNFSTLCITPTANNLCQNFIKGNYNSKPYLKCDRCLSGYAYQDHCLSSCPPGTFLHQNRYCVCQSGLTIFNECSNLTACPITLSFDVFSHSCLSCSFGCLSCIYKACTSCYPGFFLLLSPQENNCRRLSPLTECKQDYQYLDGNTCSPKNPSNLSMTLCLPSIPQCEICLSGTTDTCLRCQSPYLIYNNTCVQECPKGMIKYWQTCLLLEIGECAVPYLMPRFGDFIVNDTTMESSDAYKGYLNFTEGQVPYSFAIPQDPIGYISVYLKYISKMPATGYEHETFFLQPSWTCLKCNPGFGLSPSRQSCLPCPSSCPTCYYARPTSCLISYPVDPPPIHCPNGYIDLQLLSCLDSCNAPKYPLIKNGQLYCLEEGETGAKGDYVRVDSAAYRQNGDGEYIVYFVFDSKVYNTSNVMTANGIQNKQLANATAQIVVKSIKWNNQHTILSQSPNSTNTTTTTTKILQNQYLKLTSSSLFHTLHIPTSQLQTLTNLTFPNLIYGSTIYNTRNLYMKTWLAYIGYIMSITILILQWIYVGLGLAYKMDNLVVMVQGLGYFRYVRLLVERLLVQFYWGWSYAHGGFLPNLLEGTVPEFYAEEDAPPSYKLVNLDGNYIRNAGFSLVWLFIFFALYIIVVLFIKYILYGYFKKTDIWHPEIAYQATTTGFQFFSMNLFFFSISQLRYGGDGREQNWQFYTANQALAIITIIVLVLYTVIRFVWFSRIGGLYMFKRLALAAILVTAYQNPLYLIPTIILQLLFMFLRFLLQSPTTVSQKLTIPLESTLFLLCYILAFLCIDTGTNTVIISIIIFILIVYLAYDFIDVYLETRNQYDFQAMAKIYERDLEGEIGFRRRKIDLNQY